MQTVMDKNSSTVEVSTAPMPEGSANSASVPQSDAGQSQADGHTVLSANGDALPQGGKPLAGEQSQMAGKERPVLSVTFPDGLPVQQDTVQNYQAFCAEHGLSSEQAQQAVDFYLKEHTRLMDAERAASMQVLQEGAWEGSLNSV